MISSKEIPPARYNELFPDNDIHPTAIIYEGVKIGMGNKIGAYTVIGSPGESRSVFPLVSNVLIGNHNVITEHVTIHSPTIPHK